LKGNKKSKIK
jgi:hypothetical protein